MVLPDSTQVAGRQAGCCQKLDWMFYEETCGGDNVCTGGKQMKVSVQDIN